MNLRTINEQWFKILGDPERALPPFLEDFDLILSLYEYFNTFIGGCLLSIADTGQ